MIEKQFLRRESALWITNKMVFVYAFMLFLVYGCSNEITEKGVSVNEPLTTIRLQIDEAVGTIKQDKKETASSQSLTFNFEGENVFPKLHLKQGDETPSYCFIKNENKAIPLVMTRVKWIAEGDNLVCHGITADIKYPSNQKVGAWKVCFYLGHGDYNEKTKLLTLEAEKAIRAINKGEEQQWELPYLSNWATLEIGKDNKMRVTQVAFRPQGSFIRTQITNQTNQTISVKSLRLHATDASQSAAPFVWKGSWKVDGNENEGVNALLSTGVEDNFICTFPKTIELKPNEKSGWYGFWVMPIGKSKGYSTDIYAVTDKETDKQKLPWWVYNTPIDGKSNSQGPTAGKSYTFSFRLRKLIDTRLNNWMQDLEGNRVVAKMSIPGTHDTAANTGNAWVKTQDLDIKTQLEKGIRFFDIRLVHDNGTLKLCHSSYVFNTTFVKDVLQTTVNFLKEHPSETVIMTIKRDYDKDKDRGVAYRTAVTKALNGDKSISSYMVGDFQPDFKMKDLRGKMLIISREGWYTTKSAWVNSWPDNQSFSSNIISNNDKQATLTVEDHYKAHAGDKENYVKQNILKADAAFSQNNENPEWFITFSSYTGPWGISWPSTTTGYVDPKIKDFLEDGHKLKSSGVLLFNFAGWYDNGLTKAVIKLNKGVDLQTR